MKLKYKFLKIKKYEHYRKLDSAKIKEEENNIKEEDFKREYLIQFYKKYETNSTYKLTKALVKQGI